MEYAATAHVDHKTALQELLAPRGPAAGLPAGGGDGPAHARVFTSEVVVDGTVRGRGTGTTIKMSEQAAAQEALASLPARRGRGPMADMARLHVRPPARLQDLRQAHRAGRSSRASPSSSGRTAAARATSPTPCSGCWASRAPPTCAAAACRTSSSRVRTARRSSAVAEVSLVFDNEQGLMPLGRARGGDHPAAGARQRLRVPGERQFVPPAGRAGPGGRSGHRPGDAQRHQPGQGGGAAQLHARGPAGHGGGGGRAGPLQEAARAGAGQAGEDPAEPGARGATSSARSRARCGPCASRRRRPSGSRRPRRSGRWPRAGTCCAQVRGRAGRRREGTESELKGLEQKRGGDRGPTGRAAAGAGGGGGPVRRGAPGAGADRGGVSPAGGGGRAGPGQGGVAAAAGGAHRGRPGPGPPAAGGRPGGRGVPGSQAERRPWPAPPTRAGWSGWAAGARRCAAPWRRPWPSTGTPRRRRTS